MFLIHRWDECFVRMYTVWARVGGGGDSMKRSFIKRSLRHWRLIWGSRFWGGGEATANRFTHSERRGLVYIFFPCCKTPYCVYHPTTHLCGKWCQSPIARGHQPNRPSKYPFPPSLFGLHCHQASISSEYQVWQFVPRDHSRSPLAHRRRNEKKSPRRKEGRKKRGEREKNTRWSFDYSKSFLMNISTNSWQQEISFLFF